MNYEVRLNDRVIALPKYSFKIAGMLEAQETMNSSTDSLIAKCKSMYSLFCELLTENTVKDILGEFDSCDPNEINLLYLDIINSYNSPLMEKQTMQNNSNLDKIGENMSRIDKMLQTLDAVERMK